MILAGGEVPYFRNFRVEMYCAAGTLKPLAYSRARSSEFCYPLLGGAPQNTPYPRVAVFQKLLRSLAQSSQNKTNLNERSWGRNAWRTPKNVCLGDDTLHSGTYWYRTYMAVLLRGILGIINFREYGLQVLNMVSAPGNRRNRTPRGHAIGPYYPGRPHNASLRSADVLLLSHDTCFIVWDS